MRIIGTIRSDYATKSETPVQSSLNRGAQAVLELAEEYVDGLAGLEEFSHAWLLTWLATEEEGPVALRQVPFLLQTSPRELGVFAMRGPRRPSPIGLSLVEIVAVEGNRVIFAGVDMADGTPVVDLKPYVAPFDRPAGEVRSGWFDTTELPLGATPQSLRGRPETR